MLELHSLMNFCTENNIYKLVWVPKLNHMQSLSILGCFPSDSLHLVQILKDYIYEVETNKLTSIISRLLVPF